MVKVGTRQSDAIAAAGTGGGFDHIQLDQWRLEYENTKQELILVKRQLAEKDDAILQLKTTVRKLKETLAMKEKDLQAVFAVLRAPQDAELTKSRRRELVERLLMDVQQRATALETLASERKQALDKFHYSRKFLRFQELEAEIEECNMEIERLRQREKDAAGRQGKLVGKLRISAVPVPVGVDEGVNKVMHRQDEPLPPASLTNYQLAPDDSGAVSIEKAVPSISALTQPGLSRAYPSDMLGSEGVDTREGVVSKTRRRAIEADYYKQMRLAQLEAECELKENVRIRAAREARKMRIVAEYQRQQEEMTKVKNVLLSMKRPVESGRSKGVAKLRSVVASGLAKGASPHSEEQIAQARGDSEDMESGVIDAIDDQRHQTENSNDLDTNDLQQRKAEDEPQNPLDALGAHMTIPLLNLNVCWGGDGQQKERSAELSGTSLEIENHHHQQQQQQQQHDALNDNHEGVERTTTVAMVDETAVVVTSSIESPSTSETGTPTEDAFVEATGDQLDICFDDDAPSNPDNQSQPTSCPPFSDHSIVDQSSPRPTTPLSTAEPAHTSRMKLYEEDAFDDEGADAVAGTADDGDTMEENSHEAVLFSESQEMLLPRSIDERVTSGERREVDARIDTSSESSNSIPKEAAACSPSISKTSEIDCSTEALPSAETTITETTPNDQSSDARVISQALSEHCTDTMQTGDGCDERSDEDPKGNESLPITPSGTNSFGIDTEMESVPGDADQCGEIQHTLSENRPRSPQDVLSESTAESDAQRERFQASGANPDLLMQSAVSDTAAGNEAAGTITSIAADDEAQTETDQLSSDTPDQSFTSTPRIVEEGIESIEQEPDRDETPRECGEEGSLSGSSESNAASSEVLGNGTSDDHEQELRRGTPVDETKDSMSSARGAEIDADECSSIPHEEPAETSSAVPPIIDGASDVELLQAAASPDPSESDALSPQPRTERTTPSSGSMSTTLDRSRTPELREESPDTDVEVHRATSSSDPRQLDAPSIQSPVEQTAARSLESASTVLDGPSTPASGVELPNTARSVEDSTEM